MWKKGVDPSYGRRHLKTICYDQSFKDVVVLHLWDSTKNMSQNVNLVFKNMSPLTLIKTETGLSLYIRLQSDLVLDFSRLVGPVVRRRLL